jgi:hypothetical protein
MPHTNSSIVRRTCLVLLTGVLGCGSDLVLPDTPPSQENVALTKLNGDAQIGSVGETLANPLMIKVVTESQQPAAGLEVSFELADPAAGIVSPPTATTNTEGEAVTYWKLGTLPGSYTATARLVGAEGDDKITEFSATAKPGAPDTLSAQTPLGQPGRRSQPVATPPQVRVVDRFGNPVPDVSVAWQVTAGQGTVSSPMTTTDALGVASTEWTMGNLRGVQKLTAAIESAHGSPITFTATVLF